MSLGIKIMATGVILFLFSLGWSVFLDSDKKSIWITVWCTVFILSVFAIFGGLLWWVWA